MTLTTLRIANFKAFAAARRVPLRPITLVYGANSAGKSSVLHALAPAHHAVEAGELDTQRTQIGGESIDLDDFHDRYPICDLVGISLPNGFDTTTNPTAVTRWTRLGRDDRDDVQRKFDPASAHHKLQQKFVIE